MSEFKATNQRFLNQVAIVTGASRGIGKAIAVAFAREGADIILNFSSNEKAAKETAALIEAAGRRCVLVGGSVADPAIPERLHRAAVDSLGRVDVLVNNAGISRDGHLMMMPTEAWRETVDVNLHGAFACCHAVLPTMLKQRSGVIVNMASTAGLRGRTGQVGYAATKGALIGLTQVLALQFGPHGIRVNTVAPGFVETDMVSGLLNRAGMREGILQGTPIRRPGTPEDIASITLYLAAAESSYITGQVVLSNGGLLM